MISDLKDIINSFKSGDMLPKPWTEIPISQLFFNFTRDPKPRLKPCELSVYIPIEI